MKTLKITLDDKEYEEWKRAKGDRTWHQFFRELISNSFGVESVETELLKGKLNEVCASLSKLAELCGVTCARERALLKLCSYDHDKATLMRTLLIVTNAIEDSSDPRMAMIVSAARNILVYALENEVDRVMEILKELCSKGGLS